MKKSVRHPEKGYFLSLSLKDTNAINRGRQEQGLPALSSQELVDLQILKIADEKGLLAPSTPASRALRYPAIAEELKRLSTVSS
jgi:hypothetical protein